MLQCAAKNVNPLERFVSSLPVAAVLPELLTALDCASQVLLSAPTGAGKSTWLPLQLLAHSAIHGKIILLEPRRLAARNVAQRLAELLNEKRYRWLPDACAKLRRAEYPPGSGYRRRADAHDPA
ncbi:hypothetical protein ECZU26_22880 [Escherichia coli]|nr:hypothetical protein ECZU26_22880 [Escherichia coli]